MQTHQGLYGRGTLGGVPRDSEREVTLASPA